MLDAMATLVGRLVGTALDAAFPALCVGCGQEGAAICRACLPALDARRGLPGGTPLGLLSDVPAPLLQLDWCAAFDGTVRRALHVLKYAGERRLAAPLGEAVARRWHEVGAGGDVLVPVPVHEARRRERGYDQAVLIADVAADALRLPMRACLVRRRATEAQFRLGRDRRAGNVRGAFVVAGDPRPLQGRWVVLIDDVVTTGATLAACAEALLEAGAMAVSAVTVARER
jgi:ComF family protein